MADNSTVERELDAALAHHEAGRLDLAEAGYRAVLKQEPDEPDALNLLGAIMQARGGLTESIRLLSRAVAIEPDFPEALANLARAQRASGNPVAAADAARHAIALDPDLAEGRLQLGLVLIDLGDNRAAASELARATALMPHSVEAFYQLGVASLHLKDYQAATDAMRAVMRLDPDRIDAMVSLGAALAGLDQLDEALSWHQKAAALAPADSTTHAALAVTQRLRLDAGGSIAACRRTLELAPGRTDIWLLLGANLASSGQFMDAEACYRKALELNPDSAEARRDLAMIGERLGDLTETAKLHATLDDPAAPRIERIAAGFALGTMLNGAAEFDAAFAAFEIANRLARESMIAEGKAFDAAGLRTYVDWAIDTFRADLFATTAEWGDSSDLPVFIVGMPRSGTSLVEQIAASHSGVFGAGERRDIGDIVRTLNGGDAHHSPLKWDHEAARRLAKDHVACLRGLSGDVDRVIDKMPDNIQILGQIAVLFPHARVIICRRDLRDVCLSCYAKPFTEGMMWTYDLTELAIRTREVERLADHWRSVLPLRMIDIQYEDLVADLEGQSRRLIDFLGLEWDPTCLAFHKTERTVMTASFWQVRQTLYTGSVGRWRHYRKHLAPLFAGLAGLLPGLTDEDWDLVAADPAAALAVAVPNHRAGRLDAAEPIYRALLRRNPDDPSALHLLGLLLLDRHDPAGSIALISRSLELRPETPSAFADLARAQRLAGDAAAAVQSARRAVSLDPAQPDAHVQLGCALILTQDYTEAAEVLRRGTALGPRSVEAYLGLAAARAHEKDFRGAADAREAAVALKPDDPDLLIGFAEAQCDLGRFQEALPIFRRALVLAPNHPRAQRGTAQSLMQTNNAAGGVEVCEQALAVAPDRSELWLMLASCLCATGRFDDATEAYRRTLAIDPDSTVAMSGLAGLGKRLTEFLPPEAAATLLRDETKPVRQRVSAGFAEGADADRLGDYDAAFEAYSLANLLLCEDRLAHGYKFDRQYQKGLVDWLIANIGPETFVRTAGIGNPSELPVFVVGLPRSGTTLVEQIAASHRQVFGAGEPKGINAILAALDDEQAVVSPMSWDRTIVARQTADHIARLQSLGGNATRVIDKLPGNIMWLGQLAILFPHARIVVCRRDLRDVCLSCFFQYFDEETLVWTDDLADCGVYARETERLMAHWRRVLPFPILEIQYETLVANLESESRRLIEFLGLEWDPACLAFHKTERAVLTASLWQVRQPVYSSSVGRWRNYRRHLGPLLRELAPVLPAGAPG